MSTTTTLDFQAAITQNDENNLYQEGGDNPEKKDQLLRWILLCSSG